ncbi:putative bifunctional diguanylate cyclase/phosphodiesterase [Noviherbaspirillum sp. ST9]|uniref:putative bifunctional diguanylate cyclase/phosphodiesterase n=1 Tax=Noviherbaspirillum sp. ST9 TaxID=3401606 RepID=UPI003B589612
MDQPTLHWARYRAFAIVCGSIVALVGILIATGWAADLPALTSFGAGHSRVKFNAGATLILLGIALLALLFGERSRAARTASQWCAGAASLVACLTLIEYAGNWDLGIDQLFFDERNAHEAQYPGRMSVVGSVVVLFLGIGLILLAREARAAWIEFTVLLAGVNASIPLIGYLYGKSALYQIPFYGTVAFPVALSLLLLCAGILAARPDQGTMALITNRSAGGMTARRLLPAALILPVVIERLQFWGHEAGYYDVTVGMIMITLTSMFVFTLLILWNARILLRVDAQRNDAEDTVHQALDVLESNLHALSVSNARLVSEVGERRAVEESLFHEHERAQVTLNAIGDGVVTTDVLGNIAYMNPAAEKMTGWRNTQASGKPLHAVFQVVEPVSREPVNYSLDAVLRSHASAALPPQGILLHRDGSESAVNNSCSPIRGPTGQIIGAVLVFHDVSAVQAMAARMSYVTQHDALTDLPNRFLFNDRLAQAIGLTLRHELRAAVLFLDLDRFKHINDTLGHLIGDKLLKEIAGRLKKALRETDTVSRHGGDEFIMLLQEIADSFTAARAAGQILTSMAEPFFIDGHEMHLSASIGISICPDDGRDSETIIKHAEAAMYQAKAQGRNNYQFFMQRINERAIRRFALEGSLRRAVAREESAVYYQPKLSIAEGKVIGAEALIRWHDHRNGPVSPSQFIPIAEESGLIIPIGEWVLRQACRQNRTWQDAGYEPIPVAVNVSAVQFREKNFLRMVERVLEETGLEARYLELELTESVTMQDLELTVPLLKALKAMGVSLSIDDFGTGYSSLSYLKRFPIDSLKIDRSFVQDIASGQDDSAIITAIISMAKSLKQRVIAEGVETAAQYAFLRDQGCDEIQGYYFSGPLAATEFEHRILRPQPALS